MGACICVLGFLRVLSAKGDLLLNSPAVEFQPIKRSLSSCPVRIQVRFRMGDALNYTQNCSIYWSFYLPIIVIRPSEIFVVSELRNAKIRLVCTFSNCMVRKVNFEFIILYKSPHPCVLSVFFLSWCYAFSYKCFDFFNSYVWSSTQMLLTSIHMKILNFYAMVITLRQLNGVQTGVPTS